MKARLLAVNLDSDIGPDVQEYLRSRVQQKLADYCADREREILYGKPGGMKPRGILRA